MVKVMIFDDDRTFSILLKKDLEVCGFYVMTRFDGKDGVDEILKNAPDLILTNCELPVTSGHVIVKEIRKLNVTTPVIFFSSQGDVNEAVKCFESGGNDYIRKPVELRELLARMKNQLAYLKLNDIQIDECQCVRINDTYFDFISNTVCEENKVCHITKTQSSILKALLAKKGQIVPFENILKECLGEEDFSVAAKNSLKVQLSKLRKNLNESGVKNVRVETYRKKGMCLYV